MNEEPRDISVALTYDMRAPDFGAPAVDLYQAAVAQCAWADRLGFDAVSLLEHHASIDGYLPSPIVLGSAVAAVTERMLIRMSVVLLPLYHPIRLAEDLAVLDLIAEGRLRLTVGAGYRAEEYEQFDLDIKRRPSLMEDGVEVLKQAWTGEPFEWRGHQVRILPRPAQDPRPAIVLGGSSPASAKRAARIADDFQPVVPKLYDIYVEELAALGKPAPEPRRGRGGGGMFFHIAEDPDRGGSRSRRTRCTRPTTTRSGRRGCAVRPIRRSTAPTSSARAGCTRSSRPPKPSTSSASAAGWRSSP